MNRLSLSLSHALVLLVAIVWACATSRAVVLLALRDTTAAITCTTPSLTSTLHHLADVRLTNGASYPVCTCEQMRACVRADVRACVRACVPGAPTHIHWHAPCADNNTIAETLRQTCSSAGAALTSRILALRAWSPLWVNFYLCTQRNDTRADDTTTVVTPIASRLAASSPPYLRGCVGARSTRLLARQGDTVPATLYGGSCAEHRVRSSGAATGDDGENVAGALVLDNEDNDDGGGNRDGGDLADDGTSVTSHIECASERRPCQLTIQIEYECVRAQPLVDLSPANQTPLTPTPDAVEVPSARATNASPATVEPERSSPALPRLANVTLPPAQASSSAYTAATAAPLLVLLSSSLVSFASLYAIALCWRRQHAPPPFVDLAQLLELRAAIHAERAAAKEGAATPVAPPPSLSSAKRVSPSPRRRARDSPSSRRHHHEQQQQQQQQQQQKPPHRSHSPRSPHTRAGRFSPRPSTVSSGLHREALRSSIMVDKSRGGMAEQGGSRRRSRSGSGGDSPHPLRLAERSRMAVSPPPASPHLRAAAQATAAFSPSLSSPSSPSPPSSSSSPPAMATHVLPTFGSPGSQASSIAAAARGVDEFVPTFSRGFAPRHRPRRSLTVDDLSLDPSPFSISPRSAQSPLSPASPHPSLDVAVGAPTTTTTVSVANANEAADDGDDDDANNEDVSASNALAYVLSPRREAREAHVHPATSSSSSSLASPQAASVRPHDD